MKKLFYTTLSVLLLTSLTSEVFGWSRTDARPFWSSQYRFKVWAGIVYRPYPNGSWTTVKYGEDAVSKGEAKVTQNYSITYPPYYPFYSRQHNITQEAKRSRRKTSNYWVANVDRSRAYKRTGSDTLQEMNISFNDSLRNDTLFIDSLTGYFRAKFTGDDIARYKIIVWEAGYEGDESIEAYKVLWEAGIEYSESGGYVLLNSMPTSGYSTGSTAEYSFVEFTNLNAFVLIPGGVNQDNIVISAIAEFEEDEGAIPNSINSSELTSNYLDIINADDFVKISNRKDIAFTAAFYSIDGKKINSFELYPNEETLINKYLLDSKIVMVAIMNKNGDIVRREKLFLK
ncbi:MAG: hypothetical protein ACPGLV_04155 [Bacteroidia bacterium]